MPDITILYAGLLGLISLGLSFRSGMMRSKTGVSVGDGGNVDQLLAMRRHGNFVEHAPIALLLILLLELGGVTPIAIHIMGAGLVICRLAHAFGLKADSMSGAGRFIGAAGTALITLVASIWAIALFFMAGS